MTLIQAISGWFTSVRAGAAAAAQSVGEVLRFRRRQPLQHVHRRGSHQTAQRSGHVAARRARQSGGDQTHRAPRAVILAQPVRFALEPLGAPRIARRGLLIFLYQIILHI